MLLIPITKIPARPLGGQLRHLKRAVEGDAEK